MTGKRGRDDDEAPAWYLGMVLGPDASAELRRTERLFLELQREVRERWLWRLGRDAEELSKSFDVATRNPITFSGDAPSTLVCGQMRPKTFTAAVPFDYAEVRESAVNAAARPDAPAKKAKRRRQGDLPAPLTQAVLDAACDELPSGTARCIMSVLNCWHCATLGAEDVIAVVKSVAGRSKVLQELFPPIETYQGEIASQEQMRELEDLVHDSAGAL